MFKWERETDKYNGKQLRYYLTQGDSCGIRFRPINSETEEPIDHSLISQILFKLYKNDDTRECIFHKAFAYDDNEIWQFDMLSEENVFPIDRYKYEIEVTFIDGSVNTPCQWFFQITEQAVCK